MSENVDENTAPNSLRSHGRPLPWARALADLLTLSRLVGGVALALTPWERSAHALGQVVRWSVLLWSTDVVDGRIARLSRTPASWLGRHDMLVDSALALGAGVALARSGHLSGTLLATWFGACLLLYAIRPVATVALVFMLPLQLALPVLALVHRRPEFWLYLAWVVAVALVSLARLRWVIESFIDGLPDRPRAWVWSWLPAWLRLTPKERAVFEDSDRPPAGT